MRNGKIKTETKLREAKMSLHLFSFVVFRPPEMAAKAMSVCASAPNIPIIADAGKIFKFGSKIKEILKNARSVTKYF